MSANTLTLAIAWRDSLPLQDGLKLALEHLSRPMCNIDAVNTIADFSLQSSPVWGDAKAQWRRWYQTQRAFYRAPVRYICQNTLAA